VLTARVPVAMGRGSILLLTAWAAIPAAECAEAYLEPLTVSATRFEQSGVPTASSITIVTREDIEASGATHIVDVLRGQGGVQVSDQFGDGSRATVSMRGFGANAQANALILVDGRRLNNTDLAAPDLNTISLKDVERIEIIQGSSAILFGDHAVGGVINIITRRPAELAALVEAGAGSYDFQSQRVAVSNRDVSGIGYRLTGERRLAGNYRHNNDLKYTNALAHLAYEYGTGEVFGEVQRVDEDLELPGGLFADQVRANRRQTRFPGDFNDGTTEIGRLGVRQEITPRWQFLMELTSRQSDLEGILTGIGLEQKRRARALNPRLIGRLPFSDGTALVTLGADVEETDYRLATVFGLTANDQSMRAAYAQVVLPVVDPITVTAGVRRAWVTNDLLDTFAFPAGASLDDDVLVSSLGISVRPHPEWRFFLKREENYRFPLADEQTFTLASITGLRTQTGESFEAGAEWRGEIASAKISGYRLNLENEIDFDPTAGLFGANVNLDPTERTGIIVEGAWRSAPWLLLSGAYTFTNAEFESGAAAGNRIPFVAEHLGRLSAELSLGARTLLYGELLGVSERVASGDFTNIHAHLPGYAIGNVSLQYQWRSWRVAARVNNVTDRRYSDFAATAFNPATFITETGFFPAPERNFLLTITLAYH
jgi:iron complex outermembrane receptor protein